MKLWCTIVSTFYFSDWWHHTLVFFLYLIVPSSQHKILKFLNYFFFFINFCETSFTVNRISSLNSVYCCVSKVRRLIKLFKSKYIKIKKIHVKLNSWFLILITKSLSLPVSFQKWLILLLNNFKESSNKKFEIYIIKL